MRARLLAAAAAHLLSWVAYFAAVQAGDWDRVSPEAQALVNLTRTPVFVPDVLTEYWTRALPVVILGSLLLSGAAAAAPDAAAPALGSALAALAVDAAATALQKALYALADTTCSDPDPLLPADCARRRQWAHLGAGLGLAAAWALCLFFDHRLLARALRAPDPAALALALAGAPRAGAHFVLAFSGATLALTALAHRTSCDALDCHDADQWALTAAIGLVTAALVLVTRVNQQRLAFDTTYNQLAVFPVVVALWTADRSAYVRLSAPAETVCGFTGSVLLVVSVLTATEQALQRLPPAPPAPQPAKALSYN
jgi:hypothetical protein